jgi:hypothetical protein
LDRHFGRIAFLVGSRSYLRFRKFAGISATQRQWFDKAILRTTPALLALFSIINLWANELFKRRKFNLNLPPLLSQHSRWVRR